MSSRVDSGWRQPPVCCAVGPVFRYAIRCIWRLVIAAVLRMKTGFAAFLRVYERFAVDFCRASGRPTLEGLNAFDVPAHVSGDLRPGTERPRTSWSPVRRDLLVGGIYRRHDPLGGDALLDPVGQCRQCIEFLESHAAAAVRDAGKREETGEALGLAA